MKDYIMLAAVLLIACGIVAAAYQFDKKLFRPARRLRRRKETTYPQIIAVDFDGTLCTSAWPSIGPARWDIINAALARQAAGDKLILWTCRSGEMLEDAVMWCANRGLHFDAVNASMPEQVEHFGGDTRKVWAHEYWDDKAVKI